jgi:hypothetical protein
LIGWKNNRFLRIYNIQNLSGYLIAKWGAWNTTSIGQIACGKCIICE